MGFISARLGALSAVLLATSRLRESGAASTFTRRITLTPLAPEYARLLVQERRPEATAVERDRIVRESVGNPLALTEFSTLTEFPSVTGPEISGRHATRLPMTRRLETAFLAGVAALPGPTQEALLLAAAGEDSTLRELFMALSETGLTEDDLSPAERAGLVRLRDNDLTFRHPLLASAIYDAAGLTARRKAHAALGRVVNNSARAALHLAAATVGWDAQVANRLDDAAESALAHGASSEASSLWQSAALLSETSETRSKRLARAAETSRQAGDVASSIDIIAQLRPIARTHDVIYQLVTTEWMLSQTVAYANSRTASELIDVALTMEDAEFRTEILVFASVRCYILQDSAAVARRIADELTLMRNTGREALIEIGMALVERGRGIAIEQVLEAFQGRIRAVDAVLLNCLAFAAEEARDTIGAEMVWTAARDAFHAAGRTGDEATAVCGRASVRLLNNDIGGALTDASLAVRLSDELGLGVVGAMGAAVAAHARALRGEHDLARASIRDADERGGPEHFARVAATIAWAAGITAAAEGRVADAVAEFERTSVNGPIELWAMAEIAEPAVKAGQVGSLLRWLEKSAVEADASESDHLQMLVSRARALLSTGAQADNHFVEAIEHGLCSGAVVDLARTRMHYGEWLRRERRIKESREQLWAAMPVFEAQGLQPFARRVAGELRAAGVTTSIPSGQPADAASVLTSQELQVSQLAAQGLTNKQIADQVYLSHRTVAAHLHRAFTKLGISRRAQLSVALS